MIRIIQAQEPRHVICGGKTTSIAVSSGNIHRQDGVTLSFFHLILTCLSYIRFWNATYLCQALS